jgi:hypothetical protein
MLGNSNSTQALAQFYFAKQMVWVLEKDVGFSADPVTEICYCTETVIVATNFNGCAGYEVNGRKCLAVRKNFATETSLESRKDSV